MSPLDGTLENVPVGWRDYARSGNTVENFSFQRRNDCFFSDKLGGKIFPLFIRLLYFTNSKSFKFSSF